MTGHCNACKHAGAIYIEAEEGCTAFTPYCPVCLSEDVVVESKITGNTFMRGGDDVNAYPEQA